MTHDLFTYPNHAGWKDPDTSRDAAIRIEDSGRAGALRHSVLRELTFPRTDKEVAAALGEEITSVRPRRTELKTRGLVYDTGMRRDGQKVWQARGGST